MNQLDNPSVSIAILDYEKPVEALQLLDSIEAHANFDYELVYFSNGGDQEYVKKLYNDGYIKTLILNSKNEGCGIGTRKLINACMTEWVIYVQVDQWVSRKIPQSLINEMVDYLNNHKNVFYIDMAGNQGQGKFSERAGLLNRQKYLSIPGMDKCIGGPGPFANSQWTENLVQEYMAKEKLDFATVGRLFDDNGVWSIREYPDGAKTKHRTDTKQLWIVRPFTKKITDFPNLKLTDEEWETVLAGKWIDGTVPELDKPHSFLHWKD